jgi:hypothetical protein
MGGLAARGGLGKAEREEPGEEEEGHEQRREESEAAEGVEKGIAEEEGDGEEGGPSRGLGAEDGIDEEEIEAVEEERGCAGGGDADAGEVEDGGEKERPDGESDGGIEITAEIPVAGEVVTDSGVGVPAFVGVLRVVHPGGMVGKVGEEMGEVEAEERAEAGDPEEVQDAGSIHGPVRFSSME